MGNLTIDNLRVTLNNRQMLESVSLSVFHGERVALLGRSGSGKSLTARAVLGLLPAGAKASGTIRLGGIDVLPMPALARPATARVAMVMQDTSSALNPLATIGYQLRQPLRHCRGLSPRQAASEVADLLLKMGFTAPHDIVNRYPPELSGGQRQRICIAMALASNASFIIADEPTTALDVVTQAQILKLLRSVTADSAGPGLLFITHDLHAASHLCDRALIIENGCIVEEGAMSQILHAPRQIYTQNLVGSAHHCVVACEKVFA